MNTATVSMRIPGKLAEKLELYAKGHDRTKSYIIKKALENYLDEYLPHIPNEKTAKVIRDALSGKGMETSTYSSAEEMFKDLGL